MSQSRNIQNSSKGLKGMPQEYLHAFSKKLLDGTDSNQLPKFNKEDAEEFFSEAYCSESRNFVRPEWLPSPSTPKYQFDCSDFSLREIESALKRAKASSSPSPLDEVGYAILKKCPSLHLALLDLYNCCWRESVVPDAWKIAVIKLLPKPSATDDPTFVPSL